MFYTYYASLFSCIRIGSLVRQISIIFSCRLSTCTTNMILIVYGILLYVQRAISFRLLFLSSVFRLPISFRNIKFWKYFWKIYSCNKGVKGGPHISPQHLNISRWFWMAMEDIRNWDIILAHFNICSWELLHDTVHKVFFVLKSENLENLEPYRDVKLIDKNQILHILWNKWMNLWADPG